LLLRCGHRTAAGVREGRGENQQNRKDERDMAAPKPGRPAQRFAEFS
jgi:hypothetical protein